MSSDLKKYYISDAADVITGFPFKGEKYSTSGTRVVRGENVTIGNLRWDTIKCWNEPFKEIEKYSLEEGDIVIGMDGSRVGKNRAQIRKEELPLILAQRVARLRAKTNFSQDFLAYVIKSNLFEQYVEAIKTGTSIPHISPQQIKEFEFYAPIKKTQQLIATILSSLDDKIELNRQTNQTLEGIAQTLFQEMCVPKGEELPEGWRVGKLGELIKIKHGYAFKGEFFSDEETEDILLTPGNFKIGGGFNYSKFKYYKGEIPKDYILSEFDLVVTMTDLSKEGDTLGYSALVPTINDKILLHNQRVGKVEIKDNNILKFFLYFTMKQNEYRNFVLGSATGTTVRHTSPDRICDYNLSIPDNKTIIKFSETIKPILDNMLSNEQENQTLSTLRDSLLPKLMKGEIEI